MFKYVYVQMETKMQVPEERKNAIVDLTFEFAVKIVKFCEDLEMQKKRNLANQLFRSGTSIGANVNEAQGAESKADFIHKFKIAYKEAEETYFWLRLCQRSESLPNSNELIPELEQIKRVIGKIITTSKK